MSDNRGWLACDQLLACERIDKLIDAPSFAFLKLFPVSSYQPDKSSVYKQGGHYEVAMPIARRVGFPVVEQSA